MAVTIDSTNISNIDEGYPVAGQDNDSQGFRDNFNNIKTALEEINTDVLALDNTTAKLDTDNVFFDTENNEPVNIERANFKEVTEQINTLNDSLKTSSSPVSFTSGHYQILTLDVDAISLQPTDWPASGRLAKMTIQVSLDSSSAESSCDLTFAGNIQTDESFNNTTVIDSSSSQWIFEFWTYNGGNTIFGKYVGKFS